MLDISCYIWYVDTLAHMFYPIGYHHYHYAPHAWAFTRKIFSPHGMTFFIGSSCHHHCCHRVIVIIILSSSSSSPSSLEHMFCSHDPHPPYNKEEVTCIGGYYRVPIIGVPPSLRRTGNPKIGVIIIRIGKHISGKV